MSGIEPLEFRSNGVQRDKIVTSCGCATQRTFQDSLGYPVKLRFLNRRACQFQIEFADGGDEHGQGGEAVGDADAEEDAEGFSQQERGDRVKGAEGEDAGCQC